MKPEVRTREVVPVKWKFDSEVRLRAIVKELSKKEEGGVRDRFPVNVMTEYVSNSPKNLFCKVFVEQDSYLELPSHPGHGNDTLQQRWPGLTIEPRTKTKGMGK